MSENLQTIGSHIETEMNRMLKYFLFITLISGCSKYKTQVIPNAFREYVDMFFEEGNQRGLNMRLDEVDLTIQFGSLNGNIDFVPANLSD